jgi:hypothetical protein
MKYLLILVCCLLLGISIDLYGSVIKFAKKTKTKKERLTNIIILFFLFLSIVLLLVGFIFSINDIKDQAQNIIMVASALFTGLAFYVQYQANKQVQKQFKEQQFESQVYKLVDIYRENVYRWKKQDKKTYEDCTDRLVAVNVLETYDILLEEVNSIIIYWKSKNKSDFYSKIYKNELEKIFKEYNCKDINVDDLEFWIKSEITYIILFYGVEEKGNENIKYLFDNKLNNTFLIELTNLLSHKVSLELSNNKGFYSTFKLEKKGFNGKNQFDLHEVLAKDIDYENFSSEALYDSIHIYKYYNGIETLFSHHYRHLYNTFNYINKNNDIDYITRWKTYANLIRTQMTNTEQILFFLNSISFLGRDWELNLLTSRNNPNVTLLNKRLITKYDIIKNIPKGNRSKYKIELFYPDIEWEDLSISIDVNKKMYEIRSSFEKVYN